MEQRRVKALTCNFIRAIIHQRGRSIVSLLAGQDHKQWK